MIHIEQGQPVPENPDLRVLSVSGDYADSDLIECATIENPTFAMFAFPASFIKYGGVVFRFSDPIALGEELVKIDPSSTHDAVILFKEEDARRIKREQGDFTPENPVPADIEVSQIAQDEAQVQADAAAASSESTPVQENSVPTPETPSTPTPTPETPPPTPESTPAPAPETTPTPSPETPAPTPETPAPAPEAPAAELPVEQPIDTTTPVTDATPVAVPDVSPEAPVQTN